MQQAHDFLDESRCVLAAVDKLNNDELTQPTLFKNWTINDIVGHLHMFNHAAGLALESRQSFQQFFSPMASDLNAGKSLLRIQNDWLGGLDGKALIERWQAEFERIASVYAVCDPKRRIAWAGPDMSTRSSITARQMETWAHAQAIFDLLGTSRIETDRIKNIVHLGVNTFGWTFANRNLSVPERPPMLSVMSPSGQKWVWNEANADVGSIEGSAVEFCQVVTQTRNIGDTQLNCTGQTAQQWMNIAQCFAGPAIDPPKTGERFC